jgi:hypothetical protein
MGIENSKFNEGDVYVDYDFEEVMFRYEFSTKRWFRKFYGKKTEMDVPFDNNLLNQSILYGDEITAEIYSAGK